MPGTIDFYFEFASPYAYLASTRIDSLAERFGREAVWRPIMLGAALRITGMKPTVEQPLRREYFLHDIRRFARLLGVPLTVPPKMPMSSLAASRAYYWLADRDPRLAKRLAEAVFRAHWGEGRDLSSGESVAEVAEPLGVEREPLLAALQDPAIKERLKRETDTALDRGVFGAPYIIIDGEPFWGADRLDQVERWLEKGGW